jgi:PPK2 family polyphosphate:nucleotide phosphotransferase
MPDTTELTLHFRIDNGRGLRLKTFDPADTRHFKSKAKAEETLQRDIERLSALQEKMYAQDRWALMIVLQAMDAAGKDSTIKHVMSGVNPQGCEVVSFKTPSNEDLQHDYLWRETPHLPERGHIGIFNRSYYEEVLVVRVHPELLQTQKIPPQLVTKNIWEERFEDINAFERHLTRNGTVIRKFFLHVSREEQKKRFLERLDEPAKNWKFSLSDVRERQYWSQYQRAYEETIRATSTPHAPWYIVPADHKWFARMIVAAAIIDALEGMHLAFPIVDREQRRTLAAARKELLGKRKR